MLDCAVVGLPDDKWGERVTAVVQPHPGRAVTPDELRAFVRSRLGGVKAPKDVEVWPDLPRSRVGKVLKADIKSRLRSGPVPRPRRVYLPRRRGQSFPHPCGRVCPHLHQGIVCIPQPASPSAATAVRHTDCRAH